MSIETAKTHLRQWKRDGDVYLFDKAGDTVEMAAEALRVSPGEIAKSMSFYDISDDKIILIVTAGTSKIDNRKFKDEYGFKAKMVAFDEVEQLVGHPVGGVGPFGVKDNVKVHLDVSLKNFTKLYPACGSNNSTIELSIPELEIMSGYMKWVDVSKE
ncbi:Proline--tRNA ligase [Chryseobacterium sp. MOF25P]|uniref:YbaK/EbsC family protein n=1 Tax=unclassified Chryseobacterium TaxID=2593645 RepID=UPI0008050461|nr:MULTISPECIES: YbaK/EbsC family protein [unclassified Chryseobacterium]OBW43344.1 Proline--tRNA ligase [Chryseobacterium sp. MOF25P]OBW46998.1 Proline--tRNA ligase [Chryseobacterium sp. BGARF1]